jgi:WD40 repeat protein/tRNA A-37 threonylcarbamoyl transferase component Bud32
MSENNPLPAPDGENSVLPGTENFLNPSSQPPAQDGAATETDSPPPTPAFPRIPGYEILGELGRGGMGVVYKARQVKLDRLVALKMILAERHAGEADLARFRTEAEAIARLQHPSIVQVYEIGEHEGKPYFSLEFCSAGSLAQRLDGTPLQPNEAARLVETLARAMEAAHQKGIIHRDLKPANVLLLTDGTPKITDFGLAKKLNEAGQTASGAVLGTPSYMAPEQASGKGKVVGPASDVYALGAILYELLTGRPPFRAPSALDTLLQVVADDPVPPRQLQSRTPKDLETICLKCLQKEPPKRYVSALDLAEDLRRYQAGESVLARPVGLGEHMLKWVKRRPVIAGLAAAVVLVTLVGIAAFAWAFAEAVNEKNKTEKALKQADEARKQANAEKAQKEKQLARAERLLLISQIAEANSHLKNQDLVRCRLTLDECRWDMRGPEYGYLINELNKKNRTIRCGNEVSCLAVNRNGNQLFTGSRDGTIKIWDAETAKEIHVLGGHVMGVTRLVASPDDTRLFSGSDDGTVKIWNLETGKLSQTLGGKEGPISRLVLSPGRKRLHAWTDWGGQRVWDSNTGKDIEPIPAELETTARVTDGKRVFSPRGTDIDSFNLQAGKVVPNSSLILRGHSDSVVRLAVSPEGDRLFSASKDQTVKFWDLEVNRETLSLQHPAPVCDLVLSSNGKRLFSASVDGTVKISNLGVGREHRTIRGHHDNVHKLILSKDGKHLISGSTDGAIKVWDLETGRATLTLGGHGRGVASLALSADGKRVFSGNVVGQQIRVWDLETGEEYPPLPGHPTIHGVSYLGVTGDGKRLVSASTDGIKVWDLGTGKAILQLPGNFGEPDSLALSRNGSLLASGSGTNGTILVRDLDRPAAEPLVGPQDPRGVTCLAISPDGKRLFSGGMDRTILMWDLEKRMSMLSLPAYRPRSLALSPDNKRLYCGGLNFGEITVWDLQSGKEILRLLGHAEAVRSLAVSGDGKWLFSGSDDWTIKVWDLEAEEQFAKSIKKDRRIEGVTESAPPKNESSHKSLRINKFGKTIAFSTSYLV